MRRCGFLQNSYKGLVSGLSSVLIFHLMTLLVKLAEQSVDHWMVIFVRSFFAIAIMLPLVLRSKPYLGKRKGLLVIRGIAGFFSISCGFYTLGHLPLLDATVLFQLAPLFVLPLSAFLLNERARPMEMILMIVGFLGILLIAKPTHGVFSFPALVGIAGSVCTAVVFIIIRELRHTDRSSVNVMYFGIVSLAGSTPNSILNLHELSLFLLLIIGITGIFASLAQWLMSTAYQYERANRIAMLNFVGVPLAALFGYLFWNERPDALTIMGGAIAIGAVIAIQVLKERKAPQKSGSTTAG